MIGQAIEGGDEPGPAGEALDPLGIVGEGKRGVTLHKWR